MMMSTKVGLSEAPPTRKPSISGCEIRFAAFSGDTDPPYLGGIQVFMMPVNDNAGE